MEKAAVEPVMGQESIFEKLLSLLETVTAAVRQNTFLLRLAYFLIFFLPSPTYPIERPYAQKDSITQQATCSRLINNT